MRKNNLSRGYRNDGHSLVKTNSKGETEAEKDKARAAVNDAARAVGLTTNPEDARKARPVVPYVLNDIKANTAATEAAIETDKVKAEPAV